MPRIFLIFFFLFYKVLPVPLPPSKQVGMGILTTLLPSSPPSSLGDLPRIQFSQLFFTFLKKPDNGFCFEVGRVPILSALVIFMPGSPLRKSAVDIPPQLGC